MTQHTEKSFNTALKEITKSSDGLANNIHNAGLFAIAQANEHGNIGFAVRLLDAMGKKHDKQRVVNWLVHFGKLGVTKGAMVFKKRKDINEANLEAWLVKAEAMPYWELTKQKPLVERVNYLSMLHSIVNKHKTVQAKLETGEKVEELNTGVLAEVEALLAKYKLPAKVAA